MVISWFPGLHGTKGQDGQSLPKRQCGHLDGTMKSSSGRRECAGSSLNLENPCMIRDEVKRILKVSKAGRKCYAIIDRVRDLSDIILNKLFLI